VERIQPQNRNRKQEVIVYEFHPLANAFPLIEGDEFAALVEDIRENGQREPITLYEGQILDGRNPYRAAIGAGLAERIIVIDTDFADFEAARAFVISANLRRRHLDSSQRSIIAARLATMRQGARTDLEHSANLPEVSQAQAASMLNVSERSVRTAKTVLDQGVPELIEAVESFLSTIQQTRRGFTKPRTVARQFASRRGVYASSPRKVSPRSRRQWGRRSSISAPEPMLSRASSARLVSSAYRTLKRLRPS
jgi:ParB-like chromosome segregation protein Spo0J